jgi:hypothetical protein
MTPQRLPIYLRFKVFFPSLILLLFFLNALSTFFRYSEPYKIVLPSYLKGVFHPQLWTKSWKYTPLLNELPHRKLEDQKILILGKIFDVFEYEFLLLPRFSQGIQSEDGCLHFLTHQQNPRPFLIIDHHFSSINYPCKQTFLAQYQQTITTPHFTLWSPR